MDPATVIASKNRIPLIAVAFAFLIFAQVPDAKAWPDIPILDTFDGWCSCPDGSVYVCSPGMTFYMDPCYFNYTFEGHPLENVGKVQVQGLEWMGDNLDYLETLAPEDLLPEMTPGLVDAVCGAASDEDSVECAALMSAGVLEGHRVAQMSDAEFVAEMGTSPQQGAFLEEILALMHLGQDMVFEDFLDEMGDIERRIMTSGMPQEEQAGPLAMATTARHITMHWMNVMGNPDHPWTQQAAHGSGGGYRPCTDWELFISGAKAAVAGATIGALVGGVPSGGIGALPGAFLGTVGGFYGGFAAALVFGC